MEKRTQTSKALNKDLEILPVVCTESEKQVCCSLRDLTFLDGVWTASQWLCSHTLRFFVGSQLSFPSFQLSLVISTGFSQGMSSLRIPLPDAIGRGNTGVSLFFISTLFGLAMGDPFALYFCSYVQRQQKMKSWNLQENGLISKALYEARSLRPRNTKTTYSLSFVDSDYNVYSMHISDGIE